MPSVAFIRKRKSLDIQIADYNIKFLGHIDPKSNIKMTNYEVVFFGRKKSRSIEVTAWFFGLEKPGLFNIELCWELGFHQIILSDPLIQSRKLKLNVSTNSSWKLSSSQHGIYGNKEWLKSSGELRPLSSLLCKYCKAARTQI